MRRPGTEPRGRNQWASFTTLANMVFAICFCAASTMASQTVGELDVVVLDQSHLPVPGARVKLASQDDVIGEVSTNEIGHAVFPSWNPGHYTISVSKEGFETVAALRKRRAP